MWRVGVALVFLVTACGSPSAPAASVTHSPSPATSVSPAPLPKPEASPFRGVFYQGGAGKLTLVDSNGTLIASAAATAPHRYNQGLPWTSTSLKRLYYLDAGGSVHFLAPDGATGVATHIALGAGEEAGFSVSPDDVKIAVAVLRYGSGSRFGGMTMYVEDLSTGGHDVVIYSSSINAEYPIAWTGGRLIVALSTPLCCASTPVNPYGAVEYHVVEPSTGNRLVTLCRGSRGPVGPPATIGVTCLPTYSNGPEYFHWDGTSCCAPGTASVGALSPDGTAAAWSSPNGIEVSFGPNSNNVANIEVSGVLGDVEGWLDPTHLVYRLTSDSGQYIGQVPGLDGPKVPDSGPGTTYQGTLPAALS